MSKLFLALLLVPLALAQSTNINRVTGLVDPGVSGTLGALNAAVTANVNSLNSTVTFTVATSGLSNATVAFEGSTDNSTWFPTIAFRADTFAQALTVANPVTAIGWVIPCGGFRAVRVRVSIYTSGSAVGNLRLGSSQILPIATVQPGNTANTTPWLSAPTAISVTTNGISGCYLQSAASTNATNCKNASGNFYGVRAVNTTGTLYYLRMYNLTSAPTCSSATGFIESIPIPASTSGAGFAFMAPIPIGDYGTGIGFCLTGGGSSTDNTSAATGVYVAVLYK